MRSTTRVVQGDFCRKQRDQKPGRACDGRAVEGFEEIEPPSDVEGAPLHALFHAPQPGEETVIVVHGFYDSKYSRYVQLTGKALVERGYGVLIPDMRWHGCLLSVDWLPSFGPLEAQDLLVWRRWLEQHHPGSPAGLVGFSAGGLHVIHALADRSAAEAFSIGGIVVSPLSALPETLANLNGRSAFPRLGTKSLVRGYFKRALRTRLRKLELLAAVEAVEAAEADGKLFLQFLEWLIAENIRRGQLEPSATKESFLGDADPLIAIRRVRVPLLLVASRDDPVIARQSVTQLASAADENSHVLFIETESGGHVGHSGTYPQWMSNILTAFFD